MIVREVDGRLMADAAALFVHLGRRIAIQTIRAHCMPARRDEESGRWLFDVEAAEAALAGVRPRNPHRRRPRRKSGLDIGRDIA